MKKIYLLALILVASLTTLFPATASASVKDSLFIRVDGKMRNMIVFTPSKMEENLPLMIVTHGMNQDPYYQYTSDRLWELIDKERFVVAYLRSSNGSWDTSGTSDQYFVEQAIGEMYALHKIDAHRVYWSGFSMGSMLMYHSMHNMTNKIAAFAPCSGIQFSEQPWKKVKGPINLIHCHAYGDEVFGYEKYGIHDYVQNMVKVNGESTYSKVSNHYTVYSWNTGDVEVWENAEGHKVELYSYNNGGHWPTKNNSVELWNFCKNYRLENIDPIPEPEKPIQYTIDLTSEVSTTPARINSAVFFPTDANCTSIWYGDSGDASQQNIKVGTCDDLSEQNYCWLKFTKVTDAKTSVTGSLYTIQLVDKDGNPYSVWGNQGYLNTPPGAWCIFALGIKNQYGEDAQNYGLWKLDYEKGAGYTIQNVGAFEAGEASYVSPAFATPQAEKQYVRLFKSLKIVDETSITPIVSTEYAATPLYDLMGQRVTEPRRGMIYIQNGRKYVQK